MKLKTVIDLHKQMKVLGEAPLLPVWLFQFYYSFAYTRIHNKYVYFKRLIRNFPAK